MLGRLSFSNKCMSLFITLYQQLHAQQKGIFVSLRRLKTYLRNRMSQERLSSLALLHIERLYVNEVLKEDMTKMIDVFGQRNSRNKYFFK